METWQDESKSLGERCVAFMKAEMDAGVKEDAPGSKTSKRIREYSSICTRMINGKETPIPLTNFDWCSASCCFALYKSKLSNEALPHGYRVGVIEVVADLQKNNLYHTIKDVQDKKYQIKIGDVVIFDRSTPGKPETSWYRHIGRVYEINSTGFTCISGNSTGGKYGFSNHLFSQKTLLGFGEYPSKPESIKEVEPSNDFSYHDFLEDNLKQA